MRPTRDDLQKWDLPHLAETVTLKPNDKYWLYDAKFYPYTTVGNDPIFAVASIRHVLVYRICRKGNQNIQLIQSIEDEDKDACTSSLAWSKDLETGAPLLCVAGSNAKIKIRDARTGALRMTLIGHGGDVNDLAVSPTNPEILASASADNTVRIWSLSPAHKKQACAVLCAGEDHLDTVLSIAFHGTGRYLLSGGQDHVVNLVCSQAPCSSECQRITYFEWTMPEDSHDYIENRQPIVVHSSHFSTSEVHSNIVDWWVNPKYRIIKSADNKSVGFNGDLILSKAFNEHCIVLWQITGFDSSAALPDPASAPTNCNSKRGTRSAFSGSSETSQGSNQYVRLLQFDVTGCSEFYMRFSLCSFPSTRPILAFCNSRSKVFFWDLSRLEEFYAYAGSISSPNQAGYHQTCAPPIWLANGRGKEKKHELLNTLQSSEASTTRAPSTPAAPTSPRPLPGSSSEPSASATRKYAMNNPLEALEAHKTVSVPKLRFDGRQVAWSVCGGWCVVAASRNVILVLKR